MNELETALQSKYVKMTDEQLAQRRKGVAAVRHEFDLARTKTENLRRQLAEAQVEEDRAMRAYQEAAHRWVDEA